MEAAGLAANSAEPRPERSQLALIGLLLALAALAWVVTADQMSGMEAMPGMGLGGFAFYVWMWVVMMAAMMFPSVAPTVRIYDRLRAGHRDRGRGAPGDATGLFVAAYLAAWTVAGVCAYGLFALVRGAEPAFLAWDAAGRYLAGGVIVGAAAYQLTPLKQACLVKCRSPLMFLAERWRHGRAGALDLGMRHGAWCLGCCWALMGALFAQCLMSLGWMALIAAFIAAEKLMPWHAAARRTVALLLLALGLGVALAPAHVPGLTTP